MEQIDGLDISRLDDATSAGQVNGKIMRGNMK